MTKTWIDMIGLGLIASCMVLAGLCPAHAETPTASPEPGTITNPINPGPDPWMQFYDGNYYLTTTQGRSIRMWKAPTLAAIKTAPPRTVWTDDDPSRSHGIWAPEFHFIDGPWKVLGFV